MVKKNTGYTGGLIRVAKGRANRDAMEEAS